MQTHKAARPVLIPARPEPVRIDIARTAVVVVDMQNAFVSKGGLFDTAGLPIDGCRAILPLCKRFIDGARETGASIVYLKFSYNAGLSNAGGADSPNWHKETALALMRERPDELGKFLTEGTWDEELVDELAPRPGDVVVRKQRYSGFAGTSLDHVLKTCGATYLLLMGIATNACVLSTLADAFFLDYWPILVEDACASMGPSFNLDAALWSVENLFGWVTNVDEALAAMRTE